MESYAFGQWTELLDTAMNVATGDVIPVEAYQVSPPASAPLYIWKDNQDGILTEPQLQKLDLMAKSSDAVIGKERLVARGDLQQEGVDYEQTYAPVIKFVSLRVISIWAAKHRNTCSTRGGDTWLMVSRTPDMQVIKNKWVFRC